MRILREHDWIRIWETDAGEYVDSKCRTYECETRIEHVMLAWHTGNAELRGDIEAALEFLPWQYGVERASLILNAMGAAEVAERVKAKWFGPSSDLRPKTIQFLVEATVRMPAASPQLVPDPMVRRPLG